MSISLDKKQSRRIFLGGAINSDTAQDVVEQILSINEEDNLEERDLKDFKRRPIILFIGSQGGEIYPANTIIDAIVGSKTPVITVCLGFAMSAALWIYCAGDVKLIGKNATLMFHDLSIDIFDKRQGIIQHLEEMNRQVEKYIKAVAESSKVKESVLRKAIEGKTDLYFSAEEAISLKLADGYYNEGELAAV